MSSKQLKNDWKLAIHDIRSTLSAMENAMNGVIANPQSKEQYQILFSMGRQRILDRVANLIGEAEKFVGSGTK